MLNSIEYGRENFDSLPDTSASSTTNDQLGLINLLKNAPKVKPTDEEIQSKEMLTAQFFGIKNPLEALPPLDQLLKLPALENITKPKPSEEETFTYRGGVDATGAIPEQERTDLVRRGLQIAGFEASEENIAHVKQLIFNESTWRPNEINLWDENAKNGTPSKGLIQTIDSTFAAYRDPRCANDVYDPLANIVAGLRYARETYGGLPPLYGY